MSKEDKKGPEHEPIFQTAFGYGKMRKFRAPYPPLKIKVDHLLSVALGRIEKQKYEIASEGKFRIPFACSEWLKIAASESGAKLLLQERPLHCDYRAGSIVCVHGLWLLDKLLEALPHNTVVKVYMHARRLSPRAIDELNASALLVWAASVPETGRADELRDLLKQAMTSKHTKDLFRGITEERLNQIVGGRSRNAFRKNVKRSGDESRVS